MSEGPRILDLSANAREETNLEKTVGSFVNRNRSNQIERQETDALKQIYDKYKGDGDNIRGRIEDITKTPGISPTTRVNTVNQLLSYEKHNNELTNKARQAQEKSSIDKDKLDIQQSRLSETQRANQLNEDKFQEQKDEKTLKKKDKTDSIKNATKVLDRMKQIRKKENIGRGSQVAGLLGGQTSRDRAEYETLGKSLISYASNINIRNQKEFEVLAENLYNPSLTLSEIDGILDAMTRIINDSAESEGLVEKQETQRPPLSSFEVK